MPDDDLIFGGYKLVSCVATGNSTQVWEAEEQGSGQRVAMKLLLPEALADTDQVKVMKHEAKVGQSLEHPNLINVHKLEANRDHAFIIMDYFRAPNLKSQIQSDRNGLHIRFRKLVESICQALAYMHEKGWLHRDIKPENILMNKGSEVRLVDFSLSDRFSTGLGKVFSGKPKMIQGTRTYIAPETIRKQHQTPQTDMYSLGVTLYEILTGSPPFRGASPNDLLRMHLGELPDQLTWGNPNVTQEMNDFVLRMLRKKPADRHESMNEIAAEFRSMKVFVEDPHDRHQREQEEAKQREMDSLDKSRNNLDSRADARRSELGMNIPTAESASRAKPKPKPKPAPRQTDAPQPAASGRAQPPQPSPQPGGQPPPGGVPGWGAPQYPGPYPQGAPPQGMPQYGGPPPGYAQQPPPQGYYQYPPQGYAGYQQPPGGFGQPPQGQQPGPGQPPPPERPAGTQPGAATGQAPPQASSEEQHAQGRPADESQQDQPQTSGNVESESTQPPVKMVRPATTREPLPEQHPSVETVDDDEDLPFMDELPDVI